MIWRRPGGLVTNDHEVVRQALGQEHEPPSLHRPGLVIAADLQRPLEDELLDGLARAGTRPSVLARRASIGKPALGELVDELEAMGYVERVADPADGRAKLVVPTSTGLAAIRAAARVIEAIEATYAAKLGDTGYRRLRKALLSLVPHAAEDVQTRT